MAEQAVGVVGIGAMGSAMARSLIDGGHRVVGFDIRPERNEALEQLGGAVAESPAAVARVSDPVILSLPGSDPLRAVVSGDGGLVESPAGNLCIETSTLPIDVKREAREALSSVGIDLIDCPISGTGDQALRKDIVFYASGPAELVERARPVLEVVGRGVHNVGAFGAGTQLKLVANLLVSVHTVVAAEALTLAAKCGLDVDEVFPVLCDGAGSSRMLEVRGPMMVRGEFPGDTATVGILDKDIGLILELAHDHSCPVPLLSMAASFMNAARGQGLGEQEPAVVAEVVARMAGLK